MADLTHLRTAKYIDLVTFRRSGVGVHTPVWFGYEDGRLYVMTLPDSGKLKRIRNNPAVRVAPATVRGRALGPEVDAVARVAPDPRRARQLVRKRYWLARIPWPWRRENVYLEISPA